MNAKSYDAEAMQSSAAKAAEFLRLLANEHRLMILCALSEEAATAGALTARLGIAQPNASQHLSRLRAQGLVVAERRGTSMHYRLADSGVRPIIEALYGRFCS